MNKPRLHFLHGNGFPAGTYRRFLSYLEPHYEIQSTERIGHHPDYPVTDCWPWLIQEIATDLRQRYQEPVILLGHSLGGLLSMLVAHQHPELVKAVVVIDAPIVAGWRAGVLWTIKKLGVDKYLSPARFSEIRKQQWPDHQAVHQHFAVKEVFQAWEPEVLWDYVHAGTEVNADGVTLRFLRDIETRIYRTMPHHMGKLIHEWPDVPLGFVGGTESKECGMAGDLHTRRLMKEHYTLISGGHLIPMEKPKETAETVLKMLQKVISQSAVTR